MKYKQLGKSGLQISVIGMGCWAIGGRRWGPTDDAESIKTVAAALDAGVNFFDTADFYGFGHSEKLLGRALKPSNEAIIATKVGLRWNRRGRIRHDLSPQYIKKACERSLKRLCRETIDLYQIHWPDPERPPAVALQAFDELRQEGKIRFGGVCNLNREQLETLPKYPWLVCYQGKYNLFNREVEEDILPYCQTQGLTFLAYQPLFKGFLTGKFKSQPSFPRGDHRRRDERFTTLFDSYRDKVNRLEKTAAATGLTLTAMALALLIKQKGVIAIPGAKLAAQIRQNAAAAEVSDKVLSSLAKQVDEVING